MIPCIFLLNGSHWAYTDNKPDGYEDRSHWVMVIWIGYGDLGDGFFGGNFRVGPVRIRPFEFGKPEPTNFGLGLGGPFARYLLDERNRKKRQMPKEIQKIYLEFIGGRVDKHGCEGSGGMK